VPEETPGPIFDQSQRGKSGLGARARLCWGRTLGSRRITRCSNARLFTQTAWLVGRAAQAGFTRSIVGRVTSAEAAEKKRLSPANRIQAACRCCCSEWAGLLHHCMHFPGSNGWRPRWPWSASGLPIKSTGRKSGHHPVASGCLRARCQSICGFSAIEKRASGGAGAKPCGPRGPHRRSIERCRQYIGATNEIPFDDFGASMQAAAAGPLYPVLVGHPRRCAASLARAHADRGHCCSISGKTNLDRATMDAFAQVD